MELAETVAIESCRDVHNTKCAESKGKDAFVNHRAEVEECVDDDEMKGSGRHLISSHSSISNLLFCVRTGCRF